MVALDIVNVHAVELLYLWIGGQKQGDPIFIISGILQYSAIEQCGHHVQHSQEGELPRPRHHPVGGGNAHLLLEKP